MLPLTRAWSDSVARQHRSARDGRGLIAPLGCISLTFDAPVSLALRVALRDRLPTTRSQVWNEPATRCHLLFRTAAAEESFSVEALAPTGLAPSAVERTTLPAGGTLVRPVFVIAAPRSGSTLLFELLSAADDVWSLPGESHAVIEGLPALATELRGFHSDRLTAADATPLNVAALHASFLTELADRDGARYLARPLDARPARVRMIEKTPKNSLRVSFLRAAFADARFVFLHRAPAENIGSIVEAWQSGQFVSRPSLPGWSGPPWSLLLPPGWAALDGRPLEELAAFQWQAANCTALDDLQALAPHERCMLDYRELVAEPHATLSRLCAFLELPFGARLQARLAAPLPLSRSAVTPPDPDKWRRIAPGLAALLPSLSSTVDRLRALR